MKKIAQKLARSKKNHYLCTAFDKNVQGRMGEWLKPAVC